MGDALAEKIAELRERFKKELEEVKQKQEEEDSKLIAVIKKRPKGTYLIFLTHHIRCQEVADIIEVKNFYFDEGVWQDFAKFFEYKGGTFLSLISKIEKWAEEKGILAHGTVKRQADKMLEEAQELWKGVYTGDETEIKDGIGDVFVTLVILCRMLGISLEECVRYAYNQIKDRKGKMVNGQFVKEE